jgi:hypothetical protein
MKLLSEKIVHTNEYAGCADLITGIEDFKTEIDFDEEWHVYTLKGKTLPSVTSLLDEGEYSNIDKDILQYAQDKGTIVHEEIENFLKNGIEGFTSEFYEFLELFKENEELFEDKAIFDFKTYATATPKNREKCFKQLTVYAKAIEYLTGEKITKKYLIHLPHDKNGRIYNLTEEFDKGE